MTLRDLALKDWHLGSDGLLKGETTRGSVLSDDLPLRRPAVAIKFNDAAAGNVVVRSQASEREMVISADSLARGIWHLYDIAQVLETNTTVDPNDFELGYVLGT